MPVNKPELQSHTRMFTQQDFFDGKCTKEGFPLDKGAQSDVPPEPETTTSPESTPEQPPAPQAAETEVVSTKGEPVGDAPDTDKSPDNTD